MKKLLILLFGLMTLLLAGCQKNDALVVPSGTDGDYTEWNRFLWECKENTPSSFTMIRTKDKNKSEMITVSYDGQRYSISDSDGTRDYTYLLPIQHTEQTEDAYIYGDYFFLTDDPKMTYERYARATQSKLSEYMDLILPTELVLGKVLTIENIAAFGQANAGMDSVLSLIIDHSVLHYGQTSFFTKEQTESEGHQLCRYDYSAKKLAAVSLSDTCTISGILEMDNGGFCFILKDAGETQLQCYDAYGQAKWSHTYTSGQETTIQQVFEKDGSLYFFGITDTDPSNYFAGDLYAAQFKIDGTILKTKTFGGSRDEQLVHIILSDDGFLVYGNTCSADGDFPFSPASVRTNFSAHISFEFTLSDAKIETTLPHAEKYYGFYQDRNIYKNDPILERKENDRMPETVDVIAILPWQDGYIILRSNQVARYPFTDPKASTTVYHRQLIATFYSAVGQPIWQTSSAPYLQ